MLPVQRIFLEHILADRLTGEIADQDILAMLGRELATMAMTGDADGAEWLIGQLIHWPPSAPSQHYLSAIACSTPEARDTVLAAADRAAPEVGAKLRRNRRWPKMPRRSKEWLRARAEQDRFHTLWSPGERFEWLTPDQLRTAVLDGDPIHTTWRDGHSVIRERVDMAFIEDELALEEATTSRLRFRAGSIDMEPPNYGATPMEDDPTAEELAFHTPQPEPIPRPDDETALADLAAAGAALRQRVERARERWIADEEEAWRRRCEEIVPRVAAWERARDRLDERLRRWEERVAAWQIEQDAWEALVAEKEAQAAAAGKRFRKPKPSHGARPSRPRLPRRPTAQPMPEIPPLEAFIEKRGVIFGVWPEQDSTIDVDNPPDVADTAICWIVRLLIDGRCREALQLIDRAVALFPEDPALVDPLLGRDDDRHGQYLLERWGDFPPPDPYCVYPHPTEFAAEVVDRLVDIGRLGGSQTARWAAHTIVRRVHAMHASQVEPDADTPLDWEDVVRAWPDGPEFLPWSACETVRLQDASMQQPRTLVRPERELGREPTPEELHLRRRATLTAWRAIAPPGWQLASWFELVRWMLGPEEALLSRGRLVERVTPFVALWSDTFVKPGQLPPDDGWEEFEDAIALYLAQQLVTASLDPTSQAIGLREALCAMIMGPSKTSDWLGAVHVGQLALRGKVHDSIANLAYRLACSLLFDIHVDPDGTLRSFDDEDEDEDDED